MTANKSHFIDTFKMLLGLYLVYYFNHSLPLNGSCLQPFICKFLHYLKYAHLTSRWMLYAYRYNKIYFVIN